MHMLLLTLQNSSIQLMREGLSDTATHGLFTTILVPVLLPSGSWLLDEE
jgi:hypothetical protein